MIAQLTGEIAYRSIDHLIVDVGGVGYRLIIPLSTFYALPDQGRVRLQVHTHVKEDAIHLYGFLTEEEKAMFILLIGVSGVGPKLAVNILSNIPAEQLHATLASGDAKQLSAVPGIGKKTAERLVLELQEKARKNLPAGVKHPTAAVAAGSGGQLLDDALSALVNLGYREAQAKKVLEAMDIGEASSVETILKGALRILVK